MNMIYVADNGFSYHAGKYYCTPPNVKNLEQYGEYFDSISVVARKTPWRDNMIEMKAGIEINLFSKLNFLAMFIYLKKIKHNFEIVLMRNGINGCVAGMFARLLNLKTIAYCGADPYEFQRAQKSIIRQLLIAPLWGKLEQIKMKKADYAQYCTKYLFNKYPTQNPYLICSNVDVSIDVNNYTERITKINQMSNAKIIGMIGRVDENKGVRTIIRALAKLGNEYSVEIIGGGDPSPFMKEAVALGVEERVSYLGYCSDKKEISNWLKKIDIYVQPSLSEGLPRSTIEAMAMACPCIATNIAGLPELLNEQYLIEPNDDEKLAELILALTTDVDAARYASLNNFEKAKEFDSSIRNKKLATFFSMITH